MQSPDVDLTPWAVATTVAAALIGPKLGPFVSAYAIILVGWFGGVLYGLYRRDSTARMPVVAYILTTLIASLMATVTLSQALAHYVPVEYTGLLAPVAAAIPAFPDRWGALLDWAIEQWKSRRGVQQ